MALTAIGKPAVAPLIEALDDENRHLQRGAAQALGALKDRRAVEPLIAALSDTHQGRAAAHYHLRSSGRADRQGTSVRTPPPGRSGSRAGKAAYEWVSACAGREPGA